MHIQFNTLTLHNFMSFGHSTLNFADDGFIKVSGINEDANDSATSNGSGKSSVWEGIVWALTGETIRGTKYVQNLHGDDGTYVQLSFKIDNTEYQILRSKEHTQYKTNLQIIIDGKDCSGKGIRESSALLAQYLPEVTASLLGSVIILGQGLPQKFTNNSPSGRKEVLEKLSKSDFMIEDLKERVAERRKSLMETLRKYEDELVSLKSKKVLLEGQISSARASLATMDKSIIETFLGQAKQEVMTLDREVASFEQTIELLNNEIGEIQSFIANIERQKNAEQELIKEAHTAKYGPLNEQYITLQAELKQVNKVLYDAENIRDICPTCGQKISGVVKPDVSGYKERVAELNASIQTLKEQGNWAQQKRDEEIKECADKYASALKEKQNELTWKQQVRNTNMSMLKQAKSALNDATIRYNKSTNELAQFEATKLGYETTISNNESEIKSIEASVMYNTSEAEAQQIRLGIISKFETILKRDFRGYLLSNVISYISNRAKEYSKIIFETDAVEFKLDGNNIEISYMNKMYENLSGGERQKIDLIIQFAIRDMLCNHLGFTSNILVLDEVFDGLDMFGCQRVLDVISSITDIKNIFIVTHRKDLSIPSDKEIVVVKSSNGISEIRG